jgi:hypothetical protein
VQITQEIVTELKTEPQISDERLNKLEDGKYKK